MTKIHTVLRVLTARPWLTAVVVVVVAGATMGFFLLSGGAGSSSAAATTTSRLVDVSTGTVSKSVATTGNLAPAVDKSVSFSTSATVTSVRVTQGAKVAKGQVLGTINDLSLKSALAQDRSTLAAARSTLSSAEDSENATSDQLGADQAQVTTAKAAVTSGKQALSGAVLRSPVAGVVAAVDVSKGDQSSGSSDSAGSAASAGSSTSVGTAGSTTTTTSGSSGDFEIIGTSKWTVSVDVDDTEIGLITKGQQAQLTTDDHTGTIFGTVTSVSVLSSSDSGSASYPVTVTVTGNPSGLHDGAEATVDIVYRQASNVLTAPSAALHSSTATSGSSTYVYLSSGGKKVKQTVTTGLTDGRTTQIKSGLKSGEQIYEDVITPGGASGSRPSGSTDGQFPGGGSGYFPGGSGGGFGGGGSGGFGRGGS